eukprot:SAG31_NODE_24758_length_474_cov_1.930667_2_plen_54_part_01
MYLRAIEWLFTPNIPSNFIPSLRLEFVALISLPNLARFSHSSSKSQKNPELRRN